MYLRRVFSMLSRQVLEAHWVMIEYGSGWSLPINWKNQLSVINANDFQNIRRNRLF